MSDFIHLPHDHFFKQQLQDLEIARDFFENYLPKEVVENLDLSDLKLADGEFVTGELKESRTDLLFQTKIADRDGFIFLHLEHQKQVSLDMAARMFLYYYQIFSKHRTQFPEEKAPLIFPFVLYQGEEGKLWNAKLTLNEYLEVPEFMKDYTPNLKYEVLDLPKTKFEEIQGSIELKLVLQTLKEAQSKNIIQILEEKIFQEITENPKQLVILRMILYYLAHANPVLDKQKIIDLKEASDKNKIKEVIMTAAEQFREEGRQQARQEMGSAAEEFRLEGEERGVVKGENHIVFKQLTLKFGKGNFPDISNFTKEQLETVAERILTFETVQDVFKGI